jgi:hypothetical protein
MVEAMKNAEPEMVQNWNQRWPVYTPVRYWKGPRPGPSKQGRTRSTAELLSGHTAVVWIEGEVGCIALTHVQPVQRAHFRTGSTYWEFDNREAPSSDWTLAATESGTCDCCGAEKVPVLHVNVCAEYGCHVCSECINAPLEAL